MLRTLYDPEDGLQKLDVNALVLFFPAPQTATGDDVLELHIHGGNAVVKAVLAAIPRTNLKGIRYAEPGEFTRRAFYNGRLDLTEVEALGDTLAAETEQQRQLAVRGSSNALAARYEDWRRRLLDARGELEALIDFSEDQQFENSPDSLLASVTGQIRKLNVLLQTSIKNAFRGELLRNGIVVALLGAPNAGKSSLLNRLVKREAAIVSKEAGTTRDIVEVGIDIAGFLCRFGDLAGLRKSSYTDLPIGDIEREGMKRAKERALDADVVIVVLCIEPESSNIRVSSEIVDVLQQIDRKRQDIVYVVNKVDLLPASTDQAGVISRLKEDLNNHDLPSSSQPIFSVSCIDQQSYVTSVDSKRTQVLLEGLTRVLRSKTSAILPNGDFPLGQPSSIDAWAESLGASERHRVLLQQCGSHLENFLVASSVTTNDSSDHVPHADFDVVVAAENLRNAADCLAKITGRGEGGDVEEVLGVVFQKFVQTFKISFDAD